jgi:hypothetical protein
MVEGMGGLQVNLRDEYVEGGRGKNLNTAEPTGNEGNRPKTGDGEEENELMKRSSQREKSLRNGTIDFRE